MNENPVTLAITAVFMILFILACIKLSNTRDEINEQAIKLHRACLVRIGEPGVKCFKDLDTCLSIKEFNKNIAIGDCQLIGDM